MQDVTGKVSLGTHFLSLDIYYIPHCHELWAPQLQPDLEMFVSSQMSLINGTAWRVWFQPGNILENVATNKTFLEPEPCQEQREQLESDDPRHPGHHPQQSWQSPGSHLTSQISSLLPLIDQPQLPSSQSIFRYQTPADADTLQRKFQPRKSSEIVGIHQPCLDYVDLCFKIISSLSDNHFDST